MSEKETPRNEEQRLFARTHEGNVHCPSCNRSVHRTYTIASDKSEAREKMEENIPSHETPRGLCSKCTCQDLIESDATINLGIEKTDSKTKTVVKKDDLASTYKVLETLRDRNNTNKGATEILNDAHFLIQEFENELKEEGKIDEKIK